MEQQPHNPHGGEQPPEVNSYGTDDPEAQAHIENARVDTARERRRDRTNFEHLIELGMRPEDAETFIEFEHFVQNQMATGHQWPTEEPPEGTPALPAVAEAGADDTVERRPRSEPRVYVADLASHNHGIQHGQWIDANQEADELDANIAAMLDSSPTVGAREWAIHDTDGFAGLDIGEHTDTVTISRLARGIDGYGAAFAAYVGLAETGHDTTIEQFEAFYVGSYDTPEDWARETAEDLEWPRVLDEAITDPFLRRYVTIDYATMASEGALSWDVATGHDGKTHVFLR
ncbi:antirestriction protein ArdA [Amycolatopsis sp. cmx-8-4]|uniref:antirestriction protein ArdA n=1 Tax=Amycolatopsis sp. cmx-8-4 TaxID=2790947 RepID=UPI00397CC628